ncbi:protein HEG homolog 1 isoform X7 [Balearica regulorum gibbericeps]|uniref:protein HEG homolog 1 isoform X7 n=1 Tax=Balearica regulorum gibbericeps TaxID=100784 RepID=UPI003F61D2BB
MPAACTLLLLLLLGLGLVPPAGSLPLASPRRLPPPPPPPPPSRSCLSHPCSPPAGGHAGSPVIESSHQVRRSSDTEIRTSGPLMDTVELVMTLAGSREGASLPARHGAVPAVSGVMGHVGSPTGSGDVTPPEAGPPDSPSARTATHLPTRHHPPAAGSHHHAAGSQERGKRALASPSTPATAESMPPVWAAVSTSSTERMLNGSRGAWDMVGFDNETRTVLLPSSVETRHLDTGGPSRPASGWVGTEPPGSPPTGTAATSPSSSGSIGGTLRLLPTTPLPGSPGQSQSSPQASSTQTGANRIVLHPRDVTGDSTSPSLTVLPATDSAFGATESSIRAAKNPRSGIQKTAPGSVAQPLASAPSSVAPAQGRFPGLSTEHQLTPSRLALESTATAIGSSYQPSNVLSTESRVSDFPTTSTSVSTTATKGGGRTLRSLPDSTRLTQTTEISTSGTEITSSSDQTRSPEMSVAAQGGGRGAADLLLTGSPSASESASMTFSSNYEPKSIPAAEEATLHSDAHGADKPSVAAGAPGSPPNGHTAEVTGGSATSTDPTSTLGGTSSSLGTGTHHPNGSREATDLPAPPGEPLLPSSLSASESTSRGVRSSHRPVNSSTTEKIPLASSPTSAFISATASSSGGRSPRTAMGSSRWAAEVSTSSGGMYGTLGTIRSSSASSVRDTYGVRGFREITDFTKRVADPSLTRSHSPSEGPSPATGSSHVSLSILSTEGRTDFPTTSASVSTTATKGGGRTLRMVTGGALAGGMETSASYAEITSSPEPAQPVSVEQSGTANVSAGGSGFAGFVTETLFTRSSKTPTYSSFQNDLTSFSSSHQPVSSIDAEKRTSVSHTDGTYISTTYTRGGERTLLSISNSSTSADSSESSTFFSEISNPSDSSKSSVAQDRRSNVSSDGGFVEPSTEPLLVHSSKLLTSASAGSVQNTTLFNTDSELLTTGRSSLSSAFPASSSLSSLHHSLSSTPPPTYLFTSSESSEPLSSSVMASSPPLQALSSSLPTSSLLSPSYSLASLLPLFSSPSSVSQSNDSDQASTSTATTVVRRVPSTAAVAESSPRETNKHSVTHQPHHSTTFTSTGSPLPTGPMEQLGERVVSMSAAMTVTETASPSAATTQEGSFGKATPLLTMASDSPQTRPTDAPLSPSPSATNHSIIIPAVALTTVKPPVLTTPASHWPTPGDASTMKAHRAQTSTATKHVYTTGESREAVDPTTARPGRVTEENIPVTSPSEAPPTSKTTVSIATTLAATKPTTVPLSSSTTGLKMSSPATDVDKCLSNPCPALATCNNTRGSYICQCPLGYELEKGKCNLVRIFIGQVPLKLNITHGKYTELLHVEGEILGMLDASLSGLPGYHHSTVKATRDANFVHVSVQSTFSLASNVTFYDVVSSVKSYIRACKAPTEACQFISSLKPLHRVGSLCKQKDPECDKETSECTDFDGVALCQCKSGYFKYNKMDHSCRACEDGYKLENETCVSCPFGLGGFNCGNPYQLITVVIAAAGGGLLLIMGVALIVTCCRKNKNDISKLIFKSGDFQMSPYAEYPKNPRTQEWGRETIEMQENGSTKNLLQMTDVYYSPTGLRNPELERNGLYPPYTGLPGSRHSCIYPGQYNPSFISDETRRRDYF